MSPTTQGAMASGADAVVILYTNYRGETAVRRIVPRKRHPMVGPNDVMWFGANDYHKGADDKPEPQWFITAEDVDRSPSVMRDFALSGIKAWGQEAVDAALAAPAPVVPEEVRRGLPLLEIQPIADRLHSRLERHSWSSLVPGGAYGLPGTQQHWLLTVQAAIEVVKDALLATAPSKPVGDGPEASAPPAGGGAVRSEDEIFDARVFAALAAWKEAQRTATVDEDQEDTDYGAMMCAVSAADALAAPEPAAGGERETQQRADILLALEAALVILGRNEPGDSRAVSDEFVAMASAVAGCMNDDGRQILLSIMAGPAPLSAPSGAETAGGDFQARVQAFMRAVAGDDATDVPERRDRFAEEAMELTQALGADREAMHQLVDYVFGRPVGEPAAEMGGTAVTLAGLAAWTGLDMAACGEAELARCNTPAMIAKIRSKRSNRHGRGALPGTLPEPTPATAGAEGGQA